MVDPQVGVTGDYEPELCGCGCGEAVQGRHSVSHSLGNGTYTLYLAKHDDVWNKAHPAPVEAPHKLRTVVRPLVMSASSSETKKGKE